ncbi:hypothetical protein [Phenylobacterium sp.]|uniref:hypothetical protein n=1 Tax=Phenylobacterium sp. TaxID=1871053 RepID=UPI00272FC7A4|nr:hypothetical protein [Phenylobacterium sp.]MDP2215449.1 hypothetical protein [Phenylobacterium sp.]
MIRGYIAAHGGLAYLETHPRRTVIARRRAAALTAVLTMASAIGLLVAVTRDEPRGPTPPDPFHLVRL